MNPSERGFTLSEVIVALFIVCVLALMGFALYAMIHFVLKFW